MWSSTFTTLLPSIQCRLTSPSRSQDATPDDPFPSGSPSSNNGTNGTIIPEGSPFVYGTDVIRGPWITPSIFNNTGNDDIVDEFTFGQLQSFDVANQTLQQHWATWITADDFVAIQEAGLNHVRIPLGFWSSVAPYIPGAWPYLLKALNWAKANSLNVILDLHGAPGSQNGYDNSGQRTSQPVWATGNFNDDANITNINRTIQILTFITSEIGGMVDVLELLNEAAGFEGAQWAAAIRQFFQDAYSEVRNVSRPDMKIMIGDAFLGVDSWQDFLTSPSAQGVLMDYHEYQIFSVPELQRTQDEHISFACSLIPDLSNFNNQNLWTVLGEWSAASTDCALWLNGRNVGSRWDGTWFPGPGSPVLGSCAGLTGDSGNFSSDYKTFLRKYWEVQVDIGESVQGWVWWTWKAENADEWDYQKGLAGGWIPQDPTEKLYPGLCSTNSTSD
ncbi:glycoside hydrolase family 5 protein [Schizopora paradoxa]|uniref:Glycoside hydrolase family 5 protein n=1 Tax=Schizopora paradoxa TaxID=27342 RepID=A0A0H2RZY8_9AGAM|nr:glycoside hydrolase family 5 protein [Schizopora paradoxa]